MPITITDTHCHLYQEEFKADLQEVIRNAAAANVQRIILPNVNIDSIEQSNSIIQQFPDTCLLALGYHPTYVDENYHKALNAIEPHIDRLPTIAIGEIGLDKYWSTEFIPQQKKAFTIQIEWALARQLPILVHSREAFDEVFEILLPYAKKGLKGVLHSFSGTLIDAQKTTEELGFYLGISGTITFKNSTLPTILSNIDPRFIITETDAPYLTPVPFRGKRNEPAYTAYVMEKLSDLYQTPIEDLSQTIEKNVCELFKLTTKARRNQ